MYETLAIRKTPLPHLLLTSSVRRAQRLFSADPYFRCSCFGNNAVSNSETQQQQRAHLAHMDGLCSFRVSLLSVLLHGNVTPRKVGMNQKREVPRRTREASDYAFTVATNETRALSERRRNKCEVYSREYRCIED